MLEGVVDFLAHAFVVDVDLDAAAGGTKRGVLQGRKAGFSHHALEHHAAGHADLDGQRFQLFLGFAVVLRKQGFRPVLRLDIVGKGHAGAAQGFELFAALNHELVLVLWSWVGEAGCGRSGLDGHRLAVPERGRKVSRCRAVKNG